MKIDIFTHVLLEKFKEGFYRYADRFPTEKRVQEKRHVLTDKEARLQKLEPYDDLAPGPVDDHAPS